MTRAAAAEEITASAFCKWSTIIHPHDNGFSSSRITDHKTGAEG